MTRQQAIDLFGGKGYVLAGALGISPAAIGNWPKTGELTQGISDRVIGAHIRHTKLRDGKTYTGKPVVLR
jgi:hypothetical protein